MTNIKSNLCKGIIIGSIFFIVFLGFFLVDYGKIIKIRREYPFLTKKDSLFCVVTNKLRNQSFRYSSTDAFIETNSGSRFCVSAININRSHDYGINDFLEVGDSLKKQPNCDTIVVIRNANLIVRGTFLILSSD